jgi:hypothetical protein
MRCAAITAVCLLFTAPLDARAQHAGDLIIGSSADGAGSLRAAFDFSRRVLVTPSVSLGGITVHTATDPGFDAFVSDDAAGGYFALDAGTVVRVEIAALDADVSLKVEATTLDAPGESALLGTMPALHVHPEWRLILPDGVLASRRVSFRLVSPAGPYAPSDVYVLTVTNDPAPPTTTTTLPGTPTTTLAGPPATTSTTLVPAPACESPPLAAAACRLDSLAAAVRAMPRDTAAARRLRRDLVRRVAAATRLTARAAGATRPVRLATRARRRVLGFAAAVMRAERDDRVTEDVAAALLEGARDAAAALVAGGAR